MKKIVTMIWQYGNNCPLARRFTRSTVDLCPQNIQTNSSIKQELHAISKLKRIKHKKIKRYFYSNCKRWKYKRIYRRYFLSKRRSLKNVKKTEVGWHVVLNEIVRRIKRRSSKYPTSAFPRICFIDTYMRHSNQVEENKTPNFPQ